jgi:hypothetical protein
MLLRTIQFITLLLGAYFFGAYLHQNWVAPLPLDISGAAFSEIIKSSISGAISKTPILIGILEIMIVLLLVLQKKEWKSLSYVLTALSFVALIVMSLINMQTVMNISKDVYALDAGKGTADWTTVKTNWLNYQYLNGMVMVAVCLNLFISIFISLLSGWKFQQQDEYIVQEHNSQIMQDQSAQVFPTAEPTIG